MIQIEDVKSIHSILINQFGGSQGIRDEASLEAAIARPYSTFDGKDLYPTPEEKASAIIESIVVNHPFVDGNKRTGYVLMRLILLNAGIDIYATEEEKYEFVIRTYYRMYQPCGSIQRTLSGWSETVDGTGRGRLSSQL